MNTAWPSAPLQGLPSRLTGLASKVMTCAAVGAILLLMRWASRSCRCNSTSACADVGLRLVLRTHPNYGSSSFVSLKAVLREGAPKKK